VSKISHITTSSKVITIVNVPRTPERTNIRRNRTETSKEQLDKQELRSRKDDKLNSELLRNNESLKILLEAAKAENLKLVKEVNKLKEKVSN
jgi:flagellar motility protein MotE (MotC chaperone)